MNYKTKVIRKSISLKKTIESSVKNEIEHNSCCTEKVLYQARASESIEMNWNLYEEYV